MMRFSFFIALLMVLLLSACGFHLRGDSQIADRFNPLFVVEDQLEPDQLSLVRKQLKRSSARLADKAHGSNQLRVKLSRLKRSKLASSSLSDVELVRISMSIQYSVQISSGNFLLKPQETVQSVEVQLDNSNVLAQEQIINTAKQELQRKLIQNMILNLSH